MSFDLEKLYNLFPAVYRIRDAEQGWALKSLLSVIAEQVAVLEEDLEQLYDDQFIETCADWVVPYIGDLLNVKGLYSVSKATFSQRARVANTISYRRRKGTATMLEQLARDTTGWNARVVEFFELLSTTQHYNHIRLHNHRTPDLRKGNILELLDTPFDTIAHTADASRINTGRGKHNVPNIGIFLWRLQAYPIKQATAFSHNDGKFTFSHLDKDMQLFNQPKTETDITHIAEEINVPGILRRRLLYDELELWRQRLTDGEKKEDISKKAVYFGEHPVLEVFIKEDTNDPFVKVEPEKMLICNLNDTTISIPDIWPLPPDEYKPAKGDAGKTFSIKAAVDPILGLIAFPSNAIPKEVKVSYSYGFSGDLGGGPYNRHESIEKWFNPLKEKVKWQIGVTRDQKTYDEALDQTQLLNNIEDAITAWNSYIKNNPDSFGLIVVMDNSTYNEPLPDIEIPAGSKLAIVAADWPVREIEGQKRRFVGDIVADGLRPHIKGNLSVKGIAPQNNLNPGELVLDGILIEGKLTIADGNLGRLQIAHCTLVPDNECLEVNSENTHLCVTINRSICGPIIIHNSINKLQIIDSIVDGKESTAIAAPNADCDLQTSSIFGISTFRSLEASNCIFTDLLIVKLCQKGCIRFSYVPADSETPRRYHCQPDLALKDKCQLEQAQIKMRLIPSFSSREYGRYDYAQLSLACDQEIRTGAEDGSEMGVFNFLKQPQRETNLRASLDEYLRFGLEAGIFYVT